jgi:hypothetical protein
VPCVFECTVSHVAGTRRRIVRAKPVEGHPSRPPLHDADGRAAAAATTSIPAIAGALASSTTQAEASRTITTAAIATAALTA